MIEFWGAIIAALLGFLGVCITILQNENVRQRSHRQVRDASRSCLLAGLLGELKSNRLLLAPYHNALTNFGGVGSNTPVVTELKFGYQLATEIFDTRINDIGLLDSPTVERVAFAYSHLKMFQSFISALEQRRGDANLATDPFPTIKLRDRKDIAGLRQHVREILTVTEDAISSLQQGLKAR